MTPRTLFQLAGRELHPPRLSVAVLVLIDYQNEYLAGSLRLDGVEEAVARAAELLAAARSAGSRIVHVAHRGAPGGLFDRAAERGAFIPALRPLPGETVVEKVRPNGFSDTDLAERIGSSGTSIVVAGFMAHNCVSSTVRAALDLGYTITVAGDACATRDLPSRDGGDPGRHNPGGRTRRARRSSRPHRFGGRTRRRLKSPVTPPRGVRLPRRSAPSEGSLP